MCIKIFSVFAVLLFPLLGYAQPQLKLVPDNIEYKNDFNRLKNVRFINEGNEILQIDSIYFKNINFYFLRFNVPWHFPVHIPPKDSIIMDCILTNDYPISVSDTSDNMIIYSGGNSIGHIKVKIDYYERETSWGNINGYIYNNSERIKNAFVYFFHNGTSLIKSVVTNDSGYFSTIIPSGNYSIAAKKDSFYTTFYGQSYSPYSSKIIKLQKNSTVNVNINLKRITSPGFTIKGLVMDSISVSPLRRAIVIVRRGGHNPSKITAGQDSLFLDTYTAIADTDGSYEIANITQPGFYFIQSFSDFYVPSYYKNNEASSPFWQQSDSLDINSDLSDINIFMPRDSSFGGGTISGTISISQGTADSYSDIIVFAQSPENKSFYNHAVVEGDGSFTLNDLPYGHYKVAVQKIGYGTAYSDEIVIDSLNTSVGGIVINFDLAGIKEVTGLPASPVLYQNYPNPFNPSTNIKFFLPEGKNVSLKIVNILGEEVTTIYKGFLASGNYQFMFNAVDLSSGAYFVTLSAGNSFLVKKILLLK